MGITPRYCRRRARRSRSSELALEIAMVACCWNSNFCLKASVGCKFLLISETAWQCGRVAQGPLQWWVAMHIGLSVDLRDDIVQCCDDSLIGVVLAVEEKEFNGSAYYLVSSFKHCKTFMGLAWWDLQLHMVFRGPIKNLVWAPSAVFIHLKCVHHSKMAGPGSFNGLKKRNWLLIGQESRSNHPGCGVWHHKDWNSSRIITAKAEPHGVSLNLVIEECASVHSSLRHLCRSMSLVTDHAIEGVEGSQ